MRRHVLPLLVLLSGLAVSCGEAPGSGSMAAGPHAALACGDCHAGSADTGLLPAASRTACAACHESSDLPVEATFANITLAHASHPGVEEGTALGCAGCHAHDSGQEELTIRTASCFLCHADLPAGNADLAAASIPEAECTTCHAQATHTAFPTSGAPIDHGTVLAQGVSCVLCHYDVAEGTGSAPAASCRDCHGRSGGPPALRDRESLTPDSIHAYHMADSADTGCGRCHEAVDHHVIKLASSLVLDCAACHEPGDPALDPPVDSAAHRAEQQLYTGLDPHHADAASAVKFIQRVSCTACHSPAVSRAPAGLARLTAINAECVACHGSRFGSLLQPSVAGMRDNTSRVGAYVRSATGDPRVRGNAAASALASAALSTWQLVNDADGIHNLPAADELLRESLADARNAFVAAGQAPPALPQLGPDPQVTSCVRCHYGVQTIQSTFRGQVVDHERHVIAGAIDCVACHSSADLFEADGRTFSSAHGLTPIPRAECSTCHHVERAADCVSCHTVGEVAALRLRADITVHVQRGDVSRSRTVGFSHSAHGGLSCAGCHEAGNVTQPAASCTSCHESHHADSRTPACSSCHGGAIRDLHQRTDHLMCGACHAPATLTMIGAADRRFCLQCHTGQAEHNPDGECSTCHFLVSPEEAMRQILSARSLPPGR